MVMTEDGVVGGGLLVPQRMPGGSRGRHMERMVPISLAPRSTRSLCKKVAMKYKVI